MKIYYVITRDPEDGVRYVADMMYTNYYNAVAHAEMIDKEWQPCVVKLINFICPSNGEWMESHKEEWDEPCISAHDPDEETCGCYT